MTQQEIKQLTWDGDALERKVVANYLTKYLVERYGVKGGSDKGFVLAINADWGFGKTFLLKNWVEDLKGLDYAAVYFDAWENDFTPEPLVGFIAELDKALKAAFKEVPVAKKLLSEAVTKAKQLWKPTGKVLATIAAKRIAGMTVDELAQLVSGFDSFGEHGDSTDTDSTDVADSQNAKTAKKKHEIEAALSKAFESSLKDHIDKKTAIVAFKDKLSLLISELEKSSKFQLPIFIFVDELDRCRPDYAIELLEGIKHLFGVPGIYFVVGTNLQQLSESTKAIYGSGFDGSRYLKRFFDLEYSLPAPSDIGFTKTLFANAAIRSNVEFLTGLQQEPYGVEDHASQLFDMYARSFSLGLRDREHVMRHVEAAVAAIKGPRVHAHYLFFLAMLYYRSPQDFDVLTDQPYNNEIVKSLMARHMKAGVMITHRRPQDSFSRQLEVSQTSISNVVMLYLQNANNNLLDLRDKDFNIYDFPTNLIGFLREEMPNPFNQNKFYQASVKEYPKLMRQAGHFV